jgi:hypothetical protein
MRSPFWLTVVGIPFRLDLLLRLEALDLLRICRSRTHRQRALGSGFLLAAHKAGYVRKPYQADDHDERNDGGRERNKGWSHHAECVGEGLL